MVLALLESSTRYNIASNVMQVGIIRHSFVLYLQHSTGYVAIIRETKIASLAELLGA